jgi:hypothetical protein
MFSKVMARCGMSWRQGPSFTGPSLTSRSAFCRVKTKFWHSAPSAFGSYRASRIVSERRVDPHFALAFGQVDAMSRLNQFGLNARGSTSVCVVRGKVTIEVRSWHLTDILARLPHVRFEGYSRSRRRPPRLPLMTQSGLLWSQTFIDSDPDRFESILL